MIEKNEMSKSFAVGALLAVAGGFTDAYSYLIRGGVFANAQTGNIVLMAVSLANKDFSRAVSYLIPILSFALGILIAELVKGKFRQSSLIHWRQIVVFFEILLLTACAFVPSGKYDTVVNIIISFVCAMQVECFRVINGNSVATTMCTGNLRSGTELLFLGVENKDKDKIIRALNYYGIILFFVAGAVIGTVLTYLTGVKSILFASVVLILVFIAMFKKEKGM